MKNKILTLLMTICLILPCTFIFASCGSSLDALDGSMANLSNYTSIGIGSISNEVATETTTASLTRITFATTQTQTTAARKKDYGKTALIGADRNGKTSKVHFHKDGNDTVPDFNVSSFNQSQRYIILTYTNESVSSIYKNQFFSNDRYFTYLIDKQTNLVFKLDIADNMGFGMYGYGITGADCGNFIIMQCSERRDQSSQEMAQYYYKVGVVDNKLQVKEFFNSTILPNRPSIVISDIYGNSIIQCGDKYYILNNAGQLNALDYALKTNTDPISSSNNPDDMTFRNYDGKIYNKERNTVLNENGIFEAAENIPEYYILPTEYLIYSTQNANYYYNADFGGGINLCFWYYGNSVIKVDKTNEVYSYTKIQLPANGTNILQYDRFIYSLIDNSKIARTDILTETTTEVLLENNVIVRSIALYGINMIEFVGTDNSLNEVHGIIDNDGNVNYNYSEPDFICYYIMPIN